MSGFTEMNDFEELTTYSMLFQKGGTDGYVVSQSVHSFPLGNILDCSVNNSLHHL